MRGFIAKPANSRALATARIKRRLERTLTFKIDLQPQKLGKCLNGQLAFLNCSASLLRQMNISRFTNGCAAAKRKNKFKSKIHSFILKPSGLYNCRSKLISLDKIKKLNKSLFTFCSPARIQLQSNRSTATLI